MVWRSSFSPNLHFFDKENGGFGLFFQARDPSATCVLNVLLHLSPRVAVSASRTVEGFNQLAKMIYFLVARFPFDSKSTAYHRCISSCIFRVLFAKNFMSVFRYKNVVSARIKSDITVLSEIYSQEAAYSIRSPDFVIAGLFCIYFLVIAVKFHAMLFFGYRLNSAT